MVGLSLHWINVCGRELPQASGRLGAQRRHNGAVACRGWHLAACARAATGAGCCGFVGFRLKRDSEIEFRVQTRVHRYLRACATCVCVRPGIGVWPWPPGPAYTTLHSLYISLFFSIFFGFRA